jgi:hypothetical protein
MLAALTGARRCDEAAVVHWTQETAYLPISQARLQREGRRSKVGHPSALHVAHEFPALRVQRSAELRLK